MSSKLNKGYCKNKQRSTKSSHSHCDPKPDCPSYNNQRPNNQRPNNRRSGNAIPSSACDRRTLLKGLSLGASASASPLAFSFFNDNSLFNGSSHFPVGILSAPLISSEGQLDVLEGQLPNDLHGHCFVAEGIPLEPNHLSPAGRGALTRFDFKPGNVCFKRRLINTPSALLQQQDLGWLERFRLLGGMLYFSPSLGFMNYCNTVPLPIGDGRFMMGFEGGEPYEFDPYTLELTNPVGHFNEWRSSLPSFASHFTPSSWFFQQIRTTAHPYWDQTTDHLFTINYGGNVGETGLNSAFLDLLQWDKTGPFKRWQVMDRNGKPAYITTTTHCFGVTRNHILIISTAARVEPFRLVGAQSIDPQQHKTPIWVVRREDLQEGVDQVVADYVELDFDTSDVVLDYDDHDQIIRIYGQYLGATDKSEPSYDGEALTFGGEVATNLAGYPVSPVDAGGMVRACIKVEPDTAYELTEAGKVLRDPVLCWDMNDPAQRSQFQNPERLKHLYWSATGFRTELLVKRMTDAYQSYPGRIFPFNRLPELDQPSSLIHLDCESMTIADAYQFPIDAIMRSPQFMPRPGSVAQDDGYLLAWVVRRNPTSNRGTGKELWVFDAKALHQGPLCVLGSNHLDFATTNHALWVDSLGQRNPDAYRVDISDYFRSRLHRHGQQVKRCVEEQILPQFS
jgi:carotenoid cleavage dioxygenase-like enzyme